MNAMASTNSAVPTIHNRKSPRRQFIVQPILDPASHDLADSTHYDKDKATPTPPIIAMLPLEEEQDTNTNQEQANGVECCYFVVGDKNDQLLHDSTPLIGHLAMPLYWLVYRHNNQISVVIEPAHSLIHARLRASIDGLDEGEFTEGHELERKWRVPNSATGVENSYFS
jgi:hypothetical protein